MRPTDFTPYYRSAIGFDRLFQMLDQVSSFDNETGFPPYNIERTGENAYRISLAVAGFDTTELKIEVKEQTLSVSGSKHADGPNTSAYLHRGIATRSFERRFQLADHVEVAGADFRNGLLHVDLVRNVPERLKPRIIEIAGTPASSNQHIEAKTAAAA